MLIKVGASTLPCGRSFFCFLHLLHSVFSSTKKSSVGQPDLDNPTKFTVLCGVVEFLYQKCMVHCVVC